MAMAPVRPDIDAAAAALRSTFGAKREIQRLPEVLWEGETVEMLATGTYGGGIGLVAMTSQRLIFFKHGIMSQTVKDFPYSKISSVQWSGGMIQGTLIAFASGAREEIKQVPKDAGRDLADKLRAHIAGAGAAAFPQQQTPRGMPSAPGVPAAPAPAPAGDIGARLATLEQLRGAGAITDAEYQDRRAKILDSL